MAGPETLRSKLDDLISNGMAITVYQAEEALRLDELIGKEADKINAVGFGAFFGSLQIILGRYIILTAAQLFEKPSSRYPIRSVPAAISFLRAQADGLVIEQRPGLLQALGRFGADVRDLQDRPDAEVTRFVADLFDEQVAHANITALKTLRDKVVAHSEAVRLKDLPKAMYAHIDEAVALARAFVGAAGWGYLSIAYEDSNGASSISHDAQRATISLRRLLERCGVLKDNREIGTDETRLD